MYGVQQDAINTIRTAQKIYDSEVVMLNFNKNISFAPLSKKVLNKSIHSSFKLWSMSVKVELYMTGILEFSKVLCSLFENIAFGRE